MNGGIIDSDYRGNVGVILINHSNQDFNIKAGDRCAQLIIEKYLANCVMLEVNALEKSKRNQCGFGSSGSDEISKFIEDFALDLSNKIKYN